MNNLPHYFIAIPIPITLKDMFLDWQNDIMNKLSYKQWPNKHDLHITLKFLGPVNESNIAALQTELKQLEDLQSFPLIVGGIGTFGNPTNPRVLWAGVENNEALTTLYQQVENCSVRHDFKKEQRKFSPHITLAKKWKGSNESGGVITDIKKKYNGAKHVFTVDEVVVYQIHPTQTPKYEIVSRYRLKRGRVNGSVK